MLFFIYFLISESIPIFSNIVNNFKKKIKMGYVYFKFQIYFYFTKHHKTTLKKKFSKIIFQFFLYKK